jgi:hypothetical protein
MNEPTASFLLLSEPAFNKLAASTNTYGSRPSQREAKRRVSTEGSKGSKGGRLQCRASTLRSHTGLLSKCKVT